MSGNGDSSVSFQCLADNAALSSLTLLLSVSPLNAESLTAVDFPDDVFLRLCLPQASKNADDIQVVVNVLDFVRSVLFVHSLVILHITLCTFIILSNTDGKSTSC